MKFNVATGQMEEDDAAPAGIAAVPTPAAPVTPPPVVPAAPSPALPGLLPDKQTINQGTSSTASTIVSPAMKAADKEVAAADAQGQKANELEAANRLAEAEIARDKLAIEADTSAHQKEQARVRLADGQRQRAELEAEAKRSTDEYKAAAAEPKTYFGEDRSREQSWALSLMFGNIAQALGGRNVGRELLDRSMAQWTDERDKKLAALQKRAESSTGLLRTFWVDHGHEALALKTLQDAAGFESLGDRIADTAARTGAQLSATAQATNARAAADYRAKAADLRAKVVESRAAKQTVGSGGGSTSYEAPKAGAGAVGDPKLMVQDSAGTAYQAVSEDDAKKARVSKGRLDGSTRKIDEVIEQARTNGPGWFGKVKSMGQPNREMEGQLASLAKALSEAQGDTSERNQKAIRARFAPDRFTNQEEFIADLTRVRDEEIRSHDDVIASATGKRAGAGKAAASSGGGVRKVVNGKPAMVYPDGTMELL